MSTIPSASTAPPPAAAAKTAADTMSAANAARASAAQSVISGSTGNSSLDVTALVTSLVNAKVAGQTGSLSAQQTKDNTRLSAIGALQAALSALQAGGAPACPRTAPGPDPATPRRTRPARTAPR